MLRLKPGGRQGEQGELGGRRGTCIQYRTRFKLNKNNTFSSISVVLLGSTNPRIKLVLTRGQESTRRPLAYTTLWKHVTFKLNNAQYLVGKIGLRWRRKKAYCIPLGTYCMPCHCPIQVQFWHWWKPSKSWLPSLFVKAYENRNVTDTIKQGNLISCLVSQLTSQNGILTLSWW